jgi:hypothetical protein
LPDLIRQSISFSETMDARVKPGRDEYDAADVRHYEERKRRSNPAIHFVLTILDCFASLAMTVPAITLTRP